MAKASHRSCLPTNPQAPHLLILHHDLWALSRKKIIFKATNLKCEFKYSVFTTMLIERKIAKKALDLLKWSPAITLLGPRQVGKTTLAKHLSKHLGKPTVHLDLENPSDLEKIRETDLFFHEHKEKCIIIDEIQRLPELFARLRVLIDAHRVAARFILLGSASPAILKKANESLTGRNIYLELPGLQWDEVRTMMTPERHWLHGGFPTPLLAQSASIQNPWHQSFLKNFIELDLPQIGMKAPSLTLYRFITMLAHSHGGLWNASTFAKSLGVSSHTIASYRDFLEKTYLIRALAPFFSNAKKKIVKSPKLYVRDSGMLHHLLRINDMGQLLGHPIVGASWEGYVMEQIISYLNAHVEELIDFSFYRTREGTECDLVISKGIEPLISIEIKMSSSPKLTRGLVNAIKDLNTRHNFVVIPGGEVPYQLREGIEVTGLSPLFKRLDRIFS